MKCFNCQTELCDQNKSTASVDVAIERRPTVVAGVHLCKPCMAIFKEDKKLLAEKITPHVIKWHMFSDLKKSREDSSNVKLNPQFPESIQIVEKDKQA